MVIKTLAPGFSWRLDAVEWPVTSDVGPGLGGVVTTTTEVSWVDPASGMLAYRGVPIEHLAGRLSYEEVAHLLITGRHPDDDAAGFSAFRRRLRRSLQLPGEVVTVVRGMDPGIHPTRSLRAAVSALGCHELAVDDDLAGSQHWREMRIVGQISALVMHILAHRRGRRVGDTRSPGGLASLTLEALLGGSPSEEQRRTLDLLWVLYAAHGLDPPTLTSMVVASCQADPYANVVAGLSALRGSREGGAGEAVLEQLLRHGNADSAAAWTEEAIASGVRIAGFGHGVYSMPDPRVVILRKATAALARHCGRAVLFDIARAVEDAAGRRLAGKGIHVNINFWAAPLFSLLGVAPAEVPCLIAVARTAGLVAMVRESLDSIRLIRPRSRFVGDRPPSEPDQ
jgi:citrate synthase